MKETLIKAATAAPNWRDGNLRGLLEQKCVQEMSLAIKDFEKEARAKIKTPDDFDDFAVEDTKAIEKENAARWYVMIDAGQFFYTDINLEDYLTDAGLLWSFLLAGTESEPLAEIGGWLVQLPAKGAKRDQAILTLAPLMIHGWTISFFQTCAELPLLLDYLRHYVHAMLEEEKNGKTEEKKVLFATFDPRVLNTLCTHRKDIAERLAQPTRAWFYWDENLTLQRLEGADDDEPVVAARSILSFSKEDVARFDQMFQTAAAQGSVMNRYGAEEKALLELLSPHLRYRLMGELFARAKTLGIERQSDCFMYCAVGLFRHLKPEAAIEFQEALKATKSSKGEKTPSASAEGGDSLTPLGTCLSQMMLQDEDAWTLPFKAEGASLLHDRMTEFAEALKDSTVVGG